MSVKPSVRPVLVAADPLLLREVFTNLLLNALEAVGDGGAVVIETGMREDLRFVTVGDNGPGFPDESRDRLFEPHFTTKATGVGIGLFTSYGIVREHHGQLLYEGSTRGAVFTVILPGPILQRRH
jgi:two-component system NtrC family sensor kinase